MDPPGLDSASDELRAYVAEKVDPLMVSMLVSLVEEMPADPIQFMLDHLDRAVPAR